MNKCLLRPSVFEKRRSTEEVEKHGLNVRTGEPGRGEVSAVKNLAFGHNGVVEFGIGIVGQRDRGTGEEGEEVLEEMTLEEAVEERDEDEENEEKVVRYWNERKRVEEETVRAGGGRTPTIKIHSSEVNKNERN